MLNHAASRISMHVIVAIATVTLATGQETRSTPTSSSGTKSTINSAGMIAEVEQAIFGRTNDFRESHDLDPVERDEHLMQAAKKFAGFMAETDKYGHRANGMTPAERAEAAGYDYCVVRENIAYRTNTGDVTANGLIDVFVQGWIESPPHRENMLADYVTHTGVGVATTDDVTYYAVQMFGRPKSAAFRVKLTNESGETKTIVFRANDQSDDVEMQPRMILKLTRCFPTKISLAGSDESTLINSTVDLKVTAQGISE